MRKYRSHKISFGREHVPSRQVTWQGKQRVCVRVSLTKTDQVLPGNVRRKILHFLAKSTPAFWSPSRRYSRERTTTTPSATATGRTLATAASAAARHEPEAGWPGEKALTNLAGVDRRQVAELAHAAVETDGTAAVALAVEQAVLVVARG